MTRFLHTKRVPVKPGSAPSRNRALTWQRDSIQRRWIPYPEQDGFAPQQNPACFGYGEILLEYTLYVVYSK